MEEKRDSNKQPEICKQGCGFYGNPMYDNLCSKCFNDIKSDVQGLGAVSASPAAGAAAADVASELENKLLSRAACEKSNSLPATGTQSPLAQPPGTASGGATPSKELYNKKGRCAQCKQRVQLAKQAINKCRCCYFFCDKHRYPKQHECDFDFMSNDRLTLEKNNPKLNSRPKGGLSFTRID
ncbi:hypothetical protein EV183_005035 [Coemansia sp. RSA 2336]|nr:hypothetical protein EV183_005035 [Coemansia sp. RSA 2336]